ncbi:MAG: hypothetical protein QM831_28850 [Kofleriaceae bacterium]
MRAVVLVALLASTASADEIGFHWSAPAACPNLTGITERVEQRLGHPLDPAFRIEIAVTGHFVARVQIGTDTRSLTSDRCDALADAIAIVVARAAEEQTQPKPPVVEQVRIASIAVPVVMEAPVLVHRDLTVPEAPHPWSLGVRLSGVSGIGIVPEVGLGAEVAVSARIHSTMAEVSATKWLASGADKSNSHVEVGLEVTAARIGWRPENLPLRAWMSGEFGSMDGNGTNGESSGRWFAAGAGFGVGWPVRPWLRLVGSTEALIAIDRVKFTETTGQVIYAPSPISARATLGIEVGWE